MAALLSLRSAVKTERTTLPRGGAGSAAGGLCTLNLDPSFDYVACITSFASPTREPQKLLDLQLPLATVVSPLVARFALVDDESNPTPEETQTPHVGESEIHSRDQEYSTESPDTNGEDSSANSRVLGQDMEDDNSCSNVHVSASSSDGCAGSNCERFLRDRQMRIEHAAEVKKAAALAACRHKDRRGAASEAEFHSGSRAHRQSQWTAKLFLALRALHQVTGIRNRNGERGATAPPTTCASAQ